MHRLDPVEENDLLQKLEVGRANKTGADTVLEQLDVEHMKDMQSGGSQFDGVKEILEMLNSGLWNILPDHCGGEAWMEIKSVRHG